MKWNSSKPLTNQTLFVDDKTASSNEYQHHITTSKHACELS